MIAFLNETSSPPSTAIVFASLKRPVPFTHSTPFAWNRLATPPVICLTTPAFHSFAVAKSRASAPTCTPSFANVSSALDRERGLHPRLGRDAADAQARAAELGLLLDADGFRAQLPRANRGGVAAWASEDGDVAISVDPYASVPRSIYRRSGLRSAAVRPAKDLGRRAVESLQEISGRERRCDLLHLADQRHPLFAADRAARSDASSSSGSVRHSSSSVDSTSSARARSRTASNKAALPFVHAAYAILDAGGMADVLRDDYRVDCAPLRTARRPAGPTLPTGRCASVPVRSGRRPDDAAVHEAAAAALDGQCDRSRACG